jgi:predicted amidohydrolase
MREGLEGPRKVIIGTAVRPMYDWFPPLEERLEILGGMVDRMAEQADEKYKRGPDLLVLPETAVWAAGGPIERRCVPLDGPVLEVMGGRARRHGAYVVVGMYLAEDGPAYSNAAVLLDREGRVVGIYRKAFPVVDADGLLEGGVNAGQGFPVFACDFGRLGAQICYDMMFDDGWEALAARGAEVVLWPTQSPQTIRPACRALRHRYYVVSSTWRNNAAIYDPTGVTAARIAGPGVLAHEVDLDYVILPWSADLRGGAAMAERYGRRVGFNYYPAEDRGVFWSNDPDMPIRRMVEEAGLKEEFEGLGRDRRVQDRFRGGPPSRD